MREVVRALAFAAGIGVALGSGVAGAAEGTEASPPSGETAPSDVARAHYRRGVTHYELGAFDEAMREFKAAYAISKEASLLFNLAQAARGGGRFEQAAHFYRTFLRNAPDTVERPFVEERLAEIDRELARRDAARPTVIRGTDGGAKTLELAGLVTLGSGVVLAGVGAYFAIRAGDASSELDHLYEQGGTWTPSYQELYDRGQRDELIAGVFLGAAGVAVVTGGVLTYLGFTSERRAVIVTPTGGGAVLGWSCAF